MAAAASAQIPSEVKVRLEQGDFDGAIPALRAVVAKSGDGYARYLLGFACLRTFRYEAAERELTMAVAASPDDHVRRHALARALLARGKNAAAAAHLDRIIAATDTPSYRHARAMCLLNLGRTGAARVDLEKAVAGAPEHVEALFALGDLHVRVGEYQEARPFLVRVLAVRPDHLEARYRLGLAASRAGELELAVTSFRAVLERVEGHVGARYNLGRTLLRQGRAEEGRRELARFEEASKLHDEIDFALSCVKLEPRDAARRVAAAVLLCRAGRTIEALDESRAAVVLAPDDPAALRVLATALELGGRTEDAARARARAGASERSEKP